MININSTPYRNNYISFKSREFDDDSCGFDDEISKKRRDYIRDSYESRHLPYYQYIENNGRLDEYQLNALINALLGKKPKPHSKIRENFSEQSSGNSEPKVENIEPKVVEKEPTKKIDSAIMATLPLHNVKPIFSTGCYRGSTPNSDIESIKILKDAGVKHIVDLQGYDCVKCACEENDIEYLHIPVQEDLSEMNAFKSKRDIEIEVMQWISPYCTKEQVQESKDRAVATWEKDKNEYIDKFVKMINMLQEDNTYIGCEFGISRTNNAMLLNHLFNPQATKTPNCRTKFNNQYLSNIAKLYKNLTPEHKEQMGWTQEFDENFIPRLENLQKSQIEFN